MDDRDILDEMDFHREARARDLERQGVPRAEAIRRARLEFGSADAYREECRAALGYRIWDELRADVRYALPTMGQHPGFHAAAVFILALAIGINAAFFTLYSHFYLKPVTVRGVDRLYSLESRAANGDRSAGFTFEEVDAMRETSRNEMEGLFTENSMPVLIHGPVHRRGVATSVSTGYFSLLGGVPRLGRTFAPDERDKPVAVLSEQGAHRIFPDTPDPLGRTLRIRSTEWTVIGVMRGGFTGVVPISPDLWIPDRMHRTLLGPAQSFDRNGLWGVLAPGVSIQRARAALSAAASRFHRPYEPAVAGIELERQKSFANMGAGAAAWALLFAVFWTVLAIACANLANLYLARAASRTHEIAMRLSLGASRWRIVRQLVTESRITSLLGASGGCALALEAVRRAQDWTASQANLMGFTYTWIGADWRVLFYAVLLGIAAGIAFGLMPAIEITAPSLNQSAKRDGSAFAGRIRPRRMRNLLIAGQVAASLILLLSGAVLVRGVQRISTAELGFDPGPVYDLRLDNPSAAMLREIERLPGIAALGATSSVPLFGEWLEANVTAGGQTSEMRHNFVSPGYFRVLGLRVEGREFTEGDAQAQAKAALISRATAAKLWPGAPPIGRTFDLQYRDSAPTTYEVVGVVPDVASNLVFSGKDPSAIYLPAAAGSSRLFFAMARITGNVRETTEAIRQLCARTSGCDPFSLAEGAELPRRAVRALAAVSGTLAALALLITSAGLYGVASYSVIQRRREIGVHMALGASSARVVRRMLGEVLRHVAWGAAAGLPVALALTQLAASKLPEVRLFDPLAYAAVAVVLAGAIALACALPARRAAAVDPAIVLRDE